MPKSTKKSHSKKGHKKSKKVKHARSTGTKKVHGKGGYFGDLGKSIGGTAGGVVDGVVDIAKVLGFGDYKVKKNTLAENGGPPEVVNSKHSNIIRHREYLGDVTGYSAFTVQQFPINPGQSITFPWLAPIAAAYEQYEVRGMLFEFLSTASNAVATTDLAQGTVIMATEYNSNLPAFNNKSQMENHEYVSTTKPAVSCVHPIECAKQLTPQTILYVRSGTSTISGGGTPANGTYNPLAYDLGQFQIATQGLPSTCVIGELWVTYEIQFLKPRLLSATTSNVMTHLYWDSNLGVRPTVALPFQNMRNKNSGAILPAGAGTIVDIPAGKWFVMSTMGTHSSVTTAFSTLSGECNGNLVPTVNFFLTNSSGAGTSAQFEAPTAGGTNVGPGIHVACFDSPGVWYLTTAYDGTFPTDFATYDVYLIPFGSSLNLESRRAIDWDPMTILNRRVDELMAQLRAQSVMLMHDNTDSDFGEDEKHFAPPPSISTSTMDLAKALRGLVGSNSVSAA